MYRPCDLDLQVDISSNSREIKMPKYWPDTQTGSKLYLSTPGVGDRMTYGGIFWKRVLMDLTTKMYVLV